MLRLSLLLSLLALSGCRSVSGEALPTDLDGWSRFRGPNGTGVGGGSGVPEALDEAALRWRTELPPGHSSPVLHGDRIYLTALDDGRLWTYALRTDDGRVLWRRGVDRAREDTLHGKNHPASPSCAADAEGVVSFFPELGLVAYDPAGGELWRQPLGPFANLYGMGASPVLVEGRVILACDQNRGSFVAAWARRSGRELWRTERPWATSGHCTPVVREVENGPTEVLLPGSFFLDAYAVETGERRWWVGGLCFEMKSVPVLAGDRVYINGYGSPMNDPGQQIEIPPLAETDADGDGLVQKGELTGRTVAWFDFTDLDGNGTLDPSEYEYLGAALASRNGLLAIEPGGRGDRTADAVRWTYHRSIPQLPSPLLYENVLYLLNDQGGLMTTFDPDTGEVLERGRVDGMRDNFFASPVAGDGKVVLVGESGLVGILPAGGSFEPLSVSDLGEACYATPAIVAGRLYLRTEAALYCFGG